MYGKRNEHTESASLRDELRLNHARPQLFLNLIGGKQQLGTM